MLVVPGSQEVKRQAEAEGLDDIFVAPARNGAKAAARCASRMNGDQRAPRASTPSAPATATSKGGRARGDARSWRQPADRRRDGHRGCHHRRSDAQLMPQPFAAVVSPPFVLPQGRHRHRSDHPRALPHDDGHERASGVTSSPIGATTRLVPRCRLRPESAGGARRQDPGRRAQLRLRLVARARAVGLDGFRLPTSSSHVLR